MRRSRNRNLPNLITVIVRMRSEAIALVISRRGRTRHGEGRISFQFLLSIRCHSCRCSVWAVGLTRSHCSSLHGPADIWAVCSRFHLPVPAAAAHLTSLSRRLGLPRRASRGGAVAMEVEGGRELENAGKPEAETEYHSHDFEWEDLKAEVEADPAFSYHLTPFPGTTTSPAPPSSEAWRSFHRRHASGRFFKERRYVLKEFPELLDIKDCAKVLEVGCGNGSTVVPILRSNQSITVYACDCSKDTLQKANEIVSSTNGIDVKGRFCMFPMDVSKETFPDWLFCKVCQSSLDSSHHKMRKEHPISLRENQCCVGSMDFITLIFTLSAIPLDTMSTTIERCASVLKPGGLVLFRDYGLYDMTMLRFLPHQRIGFREYMRSDGTLSYFFSLEMVRKLFHAAGLLELELDYCCVRSVNRKNGKRMQRVWVHGKFQKPPI